MATDAGEDSFRSFFNIATGGFTPYRWQVQVALDGLPEILPVPTGLGKTEVALAWAWRRLVVGAGEPLHLVYCLPMRSLVTQTVQRLTGYFDALRAHDVKFDVGVYQLMGGSIDDEWARWPDKAWILIGTQDQLLSRALNRGYAMSRFEWPVHFGLLNNDCRWLIDEVQLMGPGLWTTAQLDWMRKIRFPSLKPCVTTWMSATVGTSFLKTVDRTRDGIGEPSKAQVAFEDKLRALLEDDPDVQWWRDAKRPVEWTKHDTADAIAKAAGETHRRGTLSLIICNTVAMAQAVFRDLKAEHKVLLTSRFRREDRIRHEQRLLAFDADRSAGRLSGDDPGLICVATQVVEAGVDLSAHRLWSELAPWPSVLQRLGRLNRKGDDEGVRAWLWETPKAKGRKKSDRIGPYDAQDIARAKKLVEAFALLSSSRPFSEALVELSRRCEKELREALQPTPSPLPRALDVHGLFSTERDVHGGFTDISAFVRGTDPDLDATVFWRDWSGDVPPRGNDLDGPLLEPSREGCPVSFVRLREMLESRHIPGWLWNDEADRWEALFPRDIRPGMLVMVKRDVGGYDITEGWTGDKADVLDNVPRAGRGETLRHDSWTEIGYWSRLPDHLADARREAVQMCDALELRDDNKDRPYLRTSVVEGAGLHDLGKAHPRYQTALPSRGPLPGDLAKCPRVLAVDVARDADAEAVRQRALALRPHAFALPDESWRRIREDIVRLRWAIDERLSREELERLRQTAGVRWAGHEQFRPGLRHEAASALAMWRRYREGGAAYPALAVYLAAAHHGKVRTVLRSTSREADDVFGVRREPDRLLLGSEQWPLDFSVTKDGAEGRWEGDEFVLTGHGWTGLVADLLGSWRPNEGGHASVVPVGEPRHLGPFALAYLEALVRVADWRASERPTSSLKPSEVGRED